MKYKGKNKTMISNILNSLMSKRIDEIFDIFTSSSKVETETFTVTKNGIETIIKAHFKGGILIGIDGASEKIPSEIEKLKQQKDEAIKNEDFIKAAEMRDRIKELEKPATST